MFLQFLHIPQNLQCCSSETVTPRYFQGYSSSKQNDFTPVIVTFFFSYYNWKTQVSTSNSSPNFEVIYDNPGGLLFKNKTDQKILNLGPLVGFCCCPALL